MRLETAVIGPTTSKTFRKELLVLILGQPPSCRMTSSRSGTGVSSPMVSGKPLALCVIVVRRIVR
jgi:hypothetical protein